MGPIPTNLVWIDPVLRVGQASPITTRACAWARVCARACVCVRVRAWAPVRLTLGTMFNILTYEIRIDALSILIAAN